MPSDVDGVIAALRVALQEVERQTQTSTFKTHIVNKWIGQLPGAWTGRWRRLKLKSWARGEGKAYRNDVIAHLRATLAYLEVNRDQIKAMPGWRWPFSRPSKPAPIEAEFKEVTDVPEKPPKKTGKAVRLIKGGE